MSRHRKVVPRWRAKFITLFSRAIEVTCATTRPQIIQRGKHPRGRTPIEKKNGGVCRKFLKELLRGTKILLCVRGLKLFSPLKVTSSKTAHYLLSYFVAQHQVPQTLPPWTFRGCTPQGYQKRYFNP